MTFSQELSGDAPLPEAGSEGMAESLGTNGFPMPILPIDVVEQLSGAASVLALPAHRVSLHLVEMPLKGQAQRLGALPFALEDRVGHPVEQTHHALCGTAPDGRLLAAAVDTELMTAGIAEAGARAIVPEQCLLPLPEVGGWTVWRNGRQTVVRCANGTGFGCDSAMLPALWRMAAQPELYSHGQPLPEGLPALDKSAEPLPSATDLPDLRQGAFARPQRLRAPLTALAICVVLAVAGHLGLLGLDLQRQAGIRVDLEAEATALLAEKLPDARISDDPRLLQRRLNASGPTPPAFLGLLSSVAIALQQTPVQVAALNFSRRDGMLTLQVEAPRIETLQASESALRGAGLTVTSGAVTASDGSARMTLTVRSTP